MKNNWKWLCVLSTFACLVVGSGSAGADTLKEIIQRGELIVAVQTQGPPFSFVNKSGERSGSSVEFCRLIAKEMGVKIKFQDYDWDGLIPALLSKKADLVAADMTANLKRSLRVSFTDPFYYTGQVLYKKAGLPITGLNDANKAGITVAAILGSTSAATAKRYLPNAKLKTYKGGGTMVMNAVISGHADVGVSDESSVYAMAAQFPAGSIEVFPQKLSREPLAFAVRPEDRHLLEWINLFFSWIKEDGRYDQNIDYWVKSMDWRKDHMSK